MKIAAHTAESLSARASRPRGSRFTVTIAAACLALLSTSVRADERFLTLAIVNYSSWLTPQWPALNDNFMAPPAQPFSFAPSEDSTPREASILSWVPENISFSASLFFKNAGESGSANQYTLIHSAPRVTSLGRVLDCVEAGYGQFFFYEASVNVYGDYGTKWEEPCYGYLKFNFRF